MGCSRKFQIAQFRVVAARRRTALRQLCVHEGIADGVIEMLQGAANELKAGDPADISTDVGPVIDRGAFDNIQRHIQRLKSEAKVLVAPAEQSQAASNSVANLIAPHAFEVANIADVQAEIFGPVLQVVRTTSTVSAPSRR